MRGVAPHVIEAETDSGAILFADTDRAPEAACSHGSRVQVDASISRRGANGCGNVGGLAVLLSGRGPSAAGLIVCRLRGAGCTRLPPRVFVRGCGVRVLRFVARALTPFLV